MNVRLCWAATLEIQAETGAASAVAAGSSTRKLVPLPTVISPRIAVMMLWQMASPRPVPSLAGLVEKNGSKMR